VIEAYGEADIFALASRVAADGDRDGLPNVLMEAQAAGLPAVATNVSAIPELIAGGVTGLLVKAGDAAAISDALERLIRDPALRRQLGAAGAARVAKEFDFAVCIKAVLPRFGLMQARKVEKVT